MPAKYSQLIKAVDGKHKFQMVFYDAARKQIKTTSFGAKGYQSYPDHQDLQRKQNYLSRHSNERWDEAMTPASLSRWILWDKITMSASYKAYRLRFGLELY